jgi:hypothetical protein
MKNTKRVRFLGPSLFLCLLPVLLLAQQPEFGNTVSGVIVDESGATVTGARIHLTPGNGSSDQQSISDSGGQFSFANIAPGPFHLTITAKGFAPKESSGALQAGQTLVLPQTVLTLARVNTDVQVSASGQAELAQQEVKEEEEQRLFGVLPNYYVSYIHPAVALSARLKFELAIKTTVDPVTFVVAGIAAGVEQANKDFNGYGQGVEGYAKRYGSEYADTFASIMLVRAVFPALLRQDPRYFVKGNGSKASRFGYALANAFICKGDNGRWQPKYSVFLGSLASVGVSDLYYPNNERNNVGVTFENFGISVGGNMIGNVFQEFFSKKLTPKARH